MATFYVYEHWRPDRDICFWVGKGCGARAYDLRRNPHYNNIVKKLARLGMCVEVRLVVGNLEESAAFDLERKRIAFWRAAGVSLANKTDGGEGVSGHRHSKATRQKLSEIHSGRKNPEHGVRLMGRKLSADHRARISAGLIGRAVSDETRKKLRESNIGQRRSEDARENMRAAQIGKKAAPETRLKMSASQARRWALARETV